MICNIIDRRTQPYRWLKIDAIIEATAHDNSIAESDKAERYDDSAWIGYDERTDLSLMEAFLWAHHEFPYAVTLFLYDLGNNAVLYDMSGNVIGERKSPGPHKARPSPSTRTDR